MADPLVIGVDLGGTKIAAGLVDGDGGVRERRERITPTESQEALLEALEEAVAELLGADVTAVGIGVPSIIDRRTGRALGSVNIPLGDVDLDDRLRDAVRPPGRRSRTTRTRPPSPSGASAPGQGRARWSC